MTKTFELFAYRLFRAIRDNKKALSAALPAPPASLANKEGFEQREAVRRLLDAMFQFERFARGAQKALAGNYEPKQFTLKAKRTDLHPSYDRQNFINKASDMANHVVRLMVDCQRLLQGPTWQVFLSLDGMQGNGFRDVVLDILGHDRLPKLVKAFPGCSATFTNACFLKMEFKKREAVKKLEEFFVVIGPEGLTIEEQIERIAGLCAKIMHFAFHAAASPASWPSEEDLLELDKQVRQKELEAEEAKQVHSLMAEIFGTLRPEQKALLQKYPSEVARFVAHTE